MGPNAMGLPLLRAALSRRPWWRAVSTKLPLLAAPPSASLSHHGWQWDDRQTCDENYMDLAHLLSRDSLCSGRVGCVLVRDVDDGSRRQQRQGSVIVCGVNSVLYANGRYRASDCHAEANAIAESARAGVSLLGASCYVSMDPCRHCFSLLAVAGISRIVSPRKMGVLQQQAATTLRIACSVIPDSAERRERRDARAAELIDRDQVMRRREERREMGTRALKRATVLRYSSQPLLVDCDE